MISYFLKKTTDLFFLESWNEYQIPYLKRLTSLLSVFFHTLDFFASIAKFGYVQVINTIFNCFHVVKIQNQSIGMWILLINTGFAGYTSQSDLQFITLQKYPFLQLHFISYWGFKMQLRKIIKEQIYFLLFRNDATFKMP